MFLPSRCPLCGAIGAAPCASCARGLRAAPALVPPPGCASLDACWRYDGAARALVLALKYRNRRDAVGALARALAATVPAGAIDLVTWAPTTAARVRERGFDQAEVLARAVASGLGRPCRRTLRRQGRGTQTGQGAEARHRGAAFVPDRRGVGRVRGARLLVVDDIVTTGATFAHAAAALQGAGAAAVHARAVCWTPPPAARRTFGTSAPHAGVGEVAS